MNFEIGTLPFTFLDSTAVTLVSRDQGQQQLTRILAVSQATTKPPAGELAVLSFLILQRLFLLRLGVSDPSGTRNLAMSFIVVEKFHRMIGVRVRDRAIVNGIEARRIVRDR